MWKNLAFRASVLVFLVCGAPAHTLAANASDRQIQGEILEPGQVDRGERITVYTKSGRVIEMVVEEVTGPGRTGSNADLTGIYISDITDNESHNFRNAKHRNLVVTLRQDGKKIIGKIDTLAGEYLVGTREGDTIKFFFAAFAISNYELIGEWKISAEGDVLEGSWKHPVTFASGKWNLTRSDPVVTTRHAESPMIKGWLIEDESSVEIRLADVAKIEVKKSDLATGSISKTPSIARSTGATDQECSISDEALEAIANARSAWTQAEYNPGMYDLLKEAEAAAKPPECDNDRAIDLAGRAKQLVAENEGFLPPPELSTTTVEPGQVNAEPLPSPPRGGGFGEFSLSRVSFDDNNLGGSAFLWGVALGGTVYSDYEIAFSYNDKVPLISPDLDKPAELGTGEFLHVTMQMLSLRRNWRINDATTVFALIGYSKIVIDIDHLSLCVYCGFSVNSENTYRNKLSGPAWGLGMQWKTRKNGYRALKYMDHSESGFAFRGVHLGFVLPFL